MKTRWFLLLVLLVSSTGFVLGQPNQRGKIIKPATSSIMDPNQDGYVSKTTAGFTDGKGYWVDEFELPMFGIPKLGGDVAGDNIGNPCGITDLIPDSKGYSVYALRDANNNLIFRFRVGDNNPSVEAWTILLDVDGLFGANDPNATSFNPGFELDITLIKRSNAGIRVYNIDGNENCPSPIKTYSYASNFQISVADEVTCGDLDYFYDYYVPFSEVAAAFNAATGRNIDEFTGLRYAAVVNVSATCAMDGNIADISGVDFNDYSSCVPCAFTDIIESQCPTPVVDLCETCVGFNTGILEKPTIDTPIKAGQTIITGTSQSGTYIKLSIYSRTGGTDAAPVWSDTPREEHVVLVSNSIWSVTLNAPLQAYDKIVAKAQINIDGTGCGSASGNEASTSITVVQPNVAPVAQDQTVNVVEDTPTSIVIAATDADGDAVTYSIATQPAHGTLSGSAPNLTYTPALNYNGPDSFTFTASDGILTSNTATVTINVIPVNDAPVANNQTVTTAEDTPKAITLTGSDIESDPLTYTIVTQPSNGTLSGTGANVTYTPNANYNGSDSFTFRVNDGTVDSNIATVTITVTPVPDAPISNNQNIVTDEDTPVSFTINGFDPDGNAVTYTILTNPVHGTLSGTAPNLTYSPALNYNGPDSFTFKVNDGTSDSNTATVFITVNPVNDAPIADDQTVNTIEEVATPITLTASDVDGDPLTYIIVTQPQHGTLTGTGANVSYTSDNAYVGPDSFTFKVNDGTVDSNIATVFINVESGNPAPIAQDKSVVTDEDVPVSFTVNGYDIHGEAVTYILVTNPSHGTLSGTLPNLTYSPDPNFFGVDSFTFKVNDGTSDSNIATVTITVNSVNDVPVALNQTVLYQLNTPSDFTLTAFDADGDPLTYTIVTQPANGTLSGTVPGILTYTPNGGFNGTDSFTFKVNDGTVDSNIATVTFNFDNMVNDPPVADDQCVFVFEDNNVNITLTGSDPDGDPLNFIIVTLPKHGKITGSTPNIVYTPNLNYNGQDTIWFKVNDGTIDSDDAYVCITVEPVNDPPVADSQIITVQEDEPKAITLTGSDVEGDPLTFILFNQPSHGTLTGTAPNLTYTPDPNYYGTDSFAFYVDDGNDGSNTGYITINVVPVNDDPVSSDVNVTTPEDTPVTVNLSASDVDGNSLTYSIVDAPQHGTLSCNNCANPIYTPSLNYYGSDSFTFKANDGTVDSNISTVSITITPVNDAPIADNQTVTVQEDTPKEITLTGSDVESDPLTITVITQPTHGTLSGTGDIVTYTPATDYNGPDNFTFQVNDGTLTSNVATIFINVVPVNDPPVILVNNNPVDTVYVSTPEDTPVNFCFDAEDKENDNLAVGTITNTEGGGSIVAGAGGSANEFCFTFTPDQDYNGKSIWTIDICDDGNPSLCKEVTIDIIVTPVQDAPTAHDQNVSVVEDTPTYITLDGTDPDAGDVLTYTIVTPPAHGTISGSGSEITYTPDENYNGPDSFTYKVNDGTDDSNIATVTIDVTPVNDPPIINAIPIIYVPEDSLVQICLGVIEIEGNSLTYNQPTYVSGGEGTMTRDSDNEFCFIYQPPKDFNGDSYWKFTVCDNGNPSMCSEVEVHIIVTPVNDPPIAVDDYVVAKSFLKTDPVNILANDTDVDNDPLVLTITPIVGPFHGTVTMTADGTFTYQSEQGYEGPDSIRYQVCDTGVPQLCDEGNVFIEVGPAPFRIYTGFSPNGDGINDYWRIDGIEEYPNNKVKVFDRYNNTIFLMSGYNNDENSWKGRPNHGLISGNLPDGTYYYVVDLGDGSGLLSGYVVLKKD